MTAATIERAARPSLVGVTAVLFMASVAILLQAYVTIKLTFLLAFLVAAVVGVAVRQRLMVHPRLLAFYLVMAVAGAFWAMVGLFHPGNYLTGIYEALRLYCIWSVAFTVLYTLLRARPSLGLVHAAMVVAGIGVAVMNLLALADTAAQWGLFSPSFREALDLGVGIGEGTIQITSTNIGALFLIVPYLITVHLRADAAMTQPWPSRIALVLSFITAAVSGRRALWLVVGLTPMIILGLSVVAGSFARLKLVGRRLLIASALGGAAVVGFLAVIPELPVTSTIGRFQAAFSAQDERSIQRPYLVEGFQQDPVFGSGFGAAARYLRDFERPWTGYELTYFQMLFNLGIVGVLVLGALFATYFVFVLRLLRNFPEGSATPFGLVVAYVAFLLGAYTNRYFGSFDLLFFVGLLPYLSTFRNGFDERRLTAGIAR